MVRLDRTQTRDTFPLTIYTPPRSDTEYIEIVGVVHYELESDQVELRILLVEPERSTLGAQIQTIQDTGTIHFKLGVPDLPDCNPRASEVCTHELEVDFHAPAMRDGEIIIDWYVLARARDEGSAPPADLIFDVELERGVEVLRPELPVRAPADELPEGRWRMEASQLTSLAVHPDQTRQSAHFVVRGAGPFTTSSVGFTSGFDYGGAFRGDEQASLRVALIPDSSRSGPRVEREIYLLGTGAMSIDLTIPEPLDCAPGAVCERGFTVLFEGESAGNMALHLLPHAVITGEGELPEDALVELELDPPRY